MRVKALWIVLVLSCLRPGSIRSDAHLEPPQAPAKDPPQLSDVSMMPKMDGLPAHIASAVLQEEWLFHKSIDGSHPDANEQQMVWLMNRARANPAVEGEWLATMSDSDVAGARTYFNVDLTSLRAEFSRIADQPPAAFDVRLYNAAESHSEDLIARDKQDHLGQLDRVMAAGFSFSSARGRVFSYATGPVYAHAAFNIDWGGDDGTGMQPGRGHRAAIMGSEPNLGIAMVSDSSPMTAVGPLVTTANYCTANTSRSNHYNRFLVGTVWRDKNSNEMYDAGEGLADVLVR